MQNNILSSLGAIQGGGQVGAQYGLPQSVWDAANFNYKQNTEPLIAAQQGSGNTAALNSGQEQLNLGLASLSGQQQWSNYLNSNSQGINAAFNPLGNTTNQTSNQTSAQVGQTTQNTNSQSASSTYNPGAAVGSLLAILGNTIQSSAFSYN